MRRFLVCALVPICSAVYACTPRPFVPVTGDPTGTATDVFVQSAYEAATILWVIDDSASMCQEQANLRANFQLFMDAFRTAAPTARFNMGVVTTDTSTPSVAGRLRNTPVENIGPAMSCAIPPPPIDCTTGHPATLPKWVDETTPDAARMFGCLAAVGIEGSGFETALGAARMALSPALLSDPDANMGFYIPGSLLVLVFVGDEDDCSVCVGDTCGPVPGATSSTDCAITLASLLTPVSEFVAWFSGQYDGGTGSSGDDVLVASIIGRDMLGSSDGPVVADSANPTQVLPICSITGQGSAAPAPRISDFTRGFVERLEYNICDSNFGDELGEIGDYLGARFSAGCLDHPPCPGTVAEQVVVHVTYDGATSDYAPGDDYELVCAGAGDPACPGSADSTCPLGWRISFSREVPSGADVSVVYGYDAGDGCNSGPM